MARQVYIIAKIAMIPIGHAMNLLNCRCRLVVKGLIVEYSERVVCLCWLRTITNKHTFDYFNWYFVRRTGDCMLTELGILSK